MNLNYLLIGTLLIFSTASAAKDNLQVQTLKQMYSMGKDLEKGNELITMYADKSFKEAVNIWNNAEYCIPYDVMWQSNDPPYNRSVSYKLLQNNQVQVFLGSVPNYDAASLIYKLSCTEDTCKISDIVDEVGSLKNNIYNECQ